MYSILESINLMFLKVTILASDRYSLNELVLMT